MRSARISMPLLASVFLLLASASVGGGDDGKSAPKSTKWKITAEMEESCSCDGACPCWWGNKPTKTACSGAAGFIIKKGNYGNVSLDGLALMEMVKSPDGKTMMESMGNWDLDNVYIDAKATPEQRKALEAIASQMLPPDATNKRVIKTAEITRKIDGKEHIVTVGNYGSFSAHLLDGASGTGAPKIIDPPFADPMHQQWSQGVTTKQTYADGSAQWDFANSNYMYNEFTVTSEDYAKFAAKMAKMMEKK